MACAKLNLTSSICRWIQVCEIFPWWYTAFIVSLMHMLCTCIYALSHIISTISIWESTWHCLPMSRYNAPWQICCALRVFWAWCVDLNIEAVHHMANKKLEPALWVTVLQKSPVQSYPAMHEATLYVIACCIGGNQDLHFWGCEGKAKHHSFLNSSSSSSSSCCCCCCCCWWWWRRQPFCLFQFDIRPYSVHRSIKVLKMTVFA